MPPAPLSTDIFQPAKELLMRLLIINPNTSQDVTDLIADQARKIATPDTELRFATATRGVPYIATRAEAIIGGHVALELLAGNGDIFDAAIIAAFGDPGLGAARELFDQPIVGLAEAGMLSACMLGRRFAIVSFSGTLEPWYRECVEWHGLTDRLAGILTLDRSFKSIGTVQHELTEELTQLCNTAVRTYQADVIVVAGAPLSGLAQQIKDAVPVPMIDCVSAAVLQAETLVRMNCKKATAGTFRRPQSKPSHGLDPSLEKLISRRA